MRKILIFYFIAVVFLAIDAKKHRKQPKVNEDTNANQETSTNNTQVKHDCQYEKEAWEECDLTTGIQRRTLKLKPSHTQTPDCDQIKYIERNCKKNCRYSKGIWSECTNGFKHRIDRIKTGIKSTGCESTRNITKTCKEVCNYTKSEWSSCENGLKSKTLTLVIDGLTRASTCEPTKIIKKQCGQANQRSKQKQRSRKQNSSTINT